MDVLRAIKKGKGRTISVEMEPPSLDKSIDTLFEVLDPLVDLGISWIDITYHPQRISSTTRETIKARAKPGTAGVAGALLCRYKNKGVFPVPHAICTSFDQYATQDFLIEAYMIGSRNILALRGDPPKDENGNLLDFERTRNGHIYAKDLINQIVELGHGNYLDGQKGYERKFCIGAACYPEGNSESSREQEFTWLKQKIDAGAQYLVTQMLFDSDVYSKFLEDAAKHGIDVPIIPGVKPLSTYKQLEIIPSFFHCTFPDELRQGMEKREGNSEALRNFGIEQCISLCEKLKKKELRVCTYTQPGTPLWLKLYNP